MIKTAVIGASGYIGQHLFRKYRDAFPDSVGTGFSQVSSDLVPFDLRNPQIENLMLEETQHKAVIIASAKPNVAWCEANPKESYELNVLGTLKLIKQLAKHSIHIMFLSSDYVFNGEAGNYSDKAQTNPNTEYGRQKAEIEQKLPTITDNYTILRLSKIYGTTHKDGTLIDALAASLCKGEKIKVATDQYFSPTHIDDVVSMIIYVQEKNIKGLVNLCHSDTYSRYQIALKLVEKLGVSPSLMEYMPLHAIPGMENRPLNTSLICSSSLLTMQTNLLSMNDAIDLITSHWKRAS